jgi:hypothetical protein
MGMVMGAVELSYWWKKGTCSTRQVAIKEKQIIILPFNARLAEF